jgi:formiminotetrahydrofolate cyclodeaminase
MIKDQEFVSETKSELDDLTIRGVSLADRIFAEIENKLM